MLVGRTVGMVLALTELSVGVIPQVYRIHDYNATDSSEIKNRWNSTIQALIAHRRIITLH
jgi:hypothetical protein